jgi:hypothetical protein
MRRIYTRGMIISYVPNLFVRTVGGLLMNLTNPQIKRIRQALYCAIEYEDSSLDSYAWQYKQVDKNRVWMDGVDMKYIRQIQRTIKAWQKILRLLKE